MNRSTTTGRVLRRMAGLTLVEMMITVAVLALLATIAYPIFTQQAQKGRRADAKVALEAIAQAQERLFSTTGTYTASISQLNLSAGVLQNVSCNGNCPTSAGHYRITLGTGGNNTTYTATATAIGGQAGDSACATLTLAQDGTQGGTNAAYCW